jgi:hypothetical protein
MWAIFPKPLKWKTKEAEWQGMTMWRGGLLGKPDQLAAFCPSALCGGLGEFGGEVRGADGAWHAWHPIRAHSPADQPACSFPAAPRPLSHSTKTRGC